MHLPFCSLSLAATKYIHIHTNTRDHQHLTRTSTFSLQAGFMIGSRSPAYSSSPMRGAAA
jgi:hypothetical protein